MKLSKNHTLAASCVAYVVQAIVNNLIPLLFVTFHHQFAISLAQLGFLVTVNFGIQLIVDLVAAKFVDRIGYRKCLCFAHIMAAAGLILLGILPFILPNAYIGILLSILCYAVGGGLLEVVVSPVVEACPFDNKKGKMSLLHSFYCWGHLAVILLSTLFFVTVGLENWRWLCMIWAAVPVFNFFYCLAVPFYPLAEEGKPLSFKKIFSRKIFWMLAILMVCAGAAELSMSQWISTYAEDYLQFDKTQGDLIGVGLFALLMGASRLLYSLFSTKIKLKTALIGSCVLCAAGYCVTIFSPIPALGLAGFGICGFAVGILWPGTFSLAGSSFRAGGTALFALLALAGDVGCSVGPTAVGALAEAFNNNLQIGLVVGLAFAVIAIVCLLFFKSEKKDLSGKDGQAQLEEEREQA